MGLLLIHFLEYAISINKNSNNLIRYIKSNRLFQDWPSWHIVHEWEDILCAEGKRKIWDKDSFLFFLTKIPLKKLSAKLSQLYVYAKKTSARSLVFHMIPQEHKYLVSRNDIPILIDVFKDVDLKKFKDVYENCSLICITSEEAYFYLKARLSLPFLLLPMSLPDNYFKGKVEDIKTKTIFENKDIDVIQMGRSNKRMESWMKEYLEEFPDTNYVERRLIDGKFYFYSTKDGILGEFSSRKEYFSLLERAKISLYASPGLDEGAKRTGGFNPLTPRLLEFLSQYTYIVGRYVNNEDYAGILDHIPNCENYIEFKNALSFRLQNSCDYDYFKWSQEFLKNRLTSKWNTYLDL